MGEFLGAQWLEESGAEGGLKEGIVQTFSHRGMFWVMVGELWMYLLSGDALSGWRSRSEIGTLTKGWAECIFFQSQASAGRSMTSQKEDGLNDLS
ncbi:hypothetical protein RIF29_28544 [Crotalaria pallida]|uniref:Uncharacterized protein n=1 Tax=Crotalaria pallida TaxID=3830 RepID=A0AAN9EF01_CROPI